MRRPWVSPPVLEEALIAVLSCSSSSSSSIAWLCPAAESDDGDDEYDDGAIRASPQLGAVLSRRQALDSTVCAG